ncbi:MAG TPA: hypothetical protein VKO18_17925 [Terriglobia bacterium]|nr:hypothetical protein [Terriglobia bacterium]
MTDAPMVNGDDETVGWRRAKLCVSLSSLIYKSQSCTLRQPAITREIGDRRGEGNALWNMSLALDKLGDRAQAIAHAEAALKIYEAIEDPNSAKVRAQLAQWREANP